jgi:hypothetical protein
VIEGISGAPQLPFSLREKVAGEARRMRACGGIPPVIILLSMVALETAIHDNI